MTFKKTISIVVNRILALGKSVQSNVGSSLSYQNAFVEYDVGFRFEWHVN